MKSVVGFAGASMLIAGFAVTASAASTATPQTVITRGDTMVNGRVASLNKLLAKIPTMKNVPANDQAILTANVQAQISNLKTLQAKFDADTDVKTARADVKSAIDSSRVYAVTIPQVNIAAADDRIGTIVGLMQTLLTKVQARIATVQAAGKDVTAMNAAVTDIQAKLSDATTQAQAAESGVVNLAPDNGVAATAASNKTAITAARTAIKAATADLQAARADFRTIASGLKGSGITTGPAAAGSTTASATAQ